MSKRAPPGKTYVVVHGRPPELVDFPYRPQPWWNYRGKPVLWVDDAKRTFGTEGGATHTFDEWQAWGDAGQPVDLLPEVKVIDG